MSACICLTRWPRLYILIEGVRYEVEPAETDSPDQCLVPRLVRWLWR
ncbi:hypothetical protein Q0Z83_031800 [Actinoplanes sichuanensis]|uniref:Uncharacterized protein n=1 Tax=Actinoplanes sichuanensis TaxID=512349 RepID=A0ABW4AQJ5_9ACTN|nr:hypothetical protein [Actinoplanes sichuanensis]BEL04989.1 hypothetical protein Q0Z83_031800 [Actinoplanes sichuanensis]